MRIDAHWHVIPKRYLDMLHDGKEHYGQRLEMRDTQPWLVQNNGFAFPVTPGYWRHETRIEDMKKMKVDKAIISISPTLFHYERPLVEGIEISTLMNDAVAAIAKEHPEHYIAAGTVPLQDTDAAIAEMERCYELGFRILQIGSNVNGKNYDDPTFLPFFEECSRRGMILYLHPYYVAMKDHLRKYYMTNLIGFPLDGTIAGISLTLGGVLERCPDLKVILAHGGGQFLFLLGRICHGYKMRQEVRANCTKSPDAFLSQMYFDTMVYNTSQLRMIAEIAGTDHLVLGSDYDFDMADRVAVDMIRQAGFTSVEEIDIFQNNILRLLNL